MTASVSEKQPRGQNDIEARAGQAGASPLPSSHRISDCSCSLARSFLGSKSLSSPARPTKVFPSKFSHQVHHQPSTSTPTFPPVNQLKAVYRTSNSKWSRLVSTRSPACCPPCHHPTMLSGWFFPRARPRDYEHVCVLCPPLANPPSGTRAKLNRLCGPSRREMAPSNVIARCQSVLSAATRRSRALLSLSRSPRTPPPLSPGTSPATTPTPSVACTSTPSATTPTAAPLPALTVSKPTHAASFATTTPMPLEADQPC